MILKDSEWMGFKNVFLLKYRIGFFFKSVKIVIF